MNLDLKADLVVLAACETARGRVGAGEGNDRFELGVSSPALPQS
jgi:CHAT domain-containing protein